MKVRIEKAPLPWMEAYVGGDVEVLKTKETEKVTAVQVRTPDGPTWLAAHNLRRVGEEAELRYEHPTRRT